MSRTSFITASRNQVLQCFENAVGADETLDQAVTSNHGPQRQVYRCTLHIEETKPEDGVGIFILICRTTRAFKRFLISVRPGEYA
jgi:hypothetical protein